MTLFDRGHCLWKRLVCSRRPFDYLDINAYNFFRAMSRDEIRYPDAEQFIPERFLDAEGMLTSDTPDFVYGFGRRLCPGKCHALICPSYAHSSSSGRHTADASIWSGMVTMLATLDFNLAKDADGKDIIFEAKYMNGVAR